MFPGPALASPADLSAGATSVRGVNAADREKLADYIRAQVSQPWPVFRGGYPDEAEAALIDAVLSIRTRYGNSPATGVRGAVGRWRDHRGDAQRLDDLRELASVDPGALADILGTRQVLSGGLLKAEGIAAAASALVAAGATSATQLDPQNPAHRRAYVGVKGLGPVTWVYLLMLLGHSGVKADTWIVRFVEDALDRRSSPKEAEALINAAAADLAVDATALDHAIWGHMSTRRRKRGAS